MTRTARVLTAAHEFGEEHFRPYPLSVVDITGTGVDIGAGRELWLVRVESRGRAIVVDVVVESDGRAWVRDQVAATA